MTVGNVRLVRTVVMMIAVSVFSSAVASAAPIFWTDWQPGTTCGTVTACTAAGIITTPTSTVTVTYTNPLGVGFYQPTGGIDYYVNSPSFTRNDAISPYTSAAVDNSPTGTDIIALDTAGPQTLTFSQAIANPVFAFVSLNGNGYSFLNQDFEILSVGGVDGNACGYWGCGTVTRVVVNLPNGDTLYQLNGSGEPHGAIRFLGAFDTLLWNSQTNEFWNGVTVGVQGTAEEVFPPSEVPEPATFLLVGSGVIAAWRSRRKRH